MRIRCIKQAPIVNRKQRITVWKVGDEATVPDDGYWRGLLEEGVICEVVENEAEPMAESTAEPEKPEPPKQPAMKRGRRR